MNSQLLDKPLDFATQIVLFPIISTNYIKTFEIIIMICDIIFLKKKVRINYIH